MNMRTWKFMWVVVLNIFLLLFLSLILEYGTLSVRFRKVQQNISTAIDSAIRVANSSEELFTYQYKYNNASQGVTGNETLGGSVLRTWGNGQWVSGNTYFMSMFYEKNNRFPRSQSEYNIFANGKTDKDVFEWLYGKVGSDYKNYSWANKTSRVFNNTLWGTVGTTREPSTNFRAFYNNIGKYMQTNTYVKEKSGSNYRAVLKKVPTLTLTGLMLDSNYNKNSNFTNDYLSGSLKLGKLSNGSYSGYYLTPYSLGVTYIPTEVLKPAVLSHLEQLVRFSRLKGTDFQDFDGGTGCIDTEVYINSDTPQSHIGDASSIVNDGDIEYDLSSLKVKVDYFYVDFYDNNNYLIVNEIEGSTPEYDANGGVIMGHSVSKGELPTRLSLSDSTKYKDSDSGYRMVARVSVKLKLHIPYRSSIMQWFRYLNDKSATNHFDVRLYDENTGDIDTTHDGVWFTYTTYTALTR